MWSTTNDKKYKEVTFVAAMFFSNLSHERSYSRVILITFTI